MSLSEAYIAIVGAASLEAGHVRKSLLEMGVDKDRIMVFADRLGPWEISLDGGEGEVFLPLEPEMMRRASAVFFFSGDGEAWKAVTSWLDLSKMLLFDLAGHAKAEGSFPDMLLESLPSDLPGRALSFADPAAVTMAHVLGGLEPSAIESLDLTVFQPASAKGEAGIQELFHQSASMMNFQEGPQEIFGRRVAFSLVPTGEDGETESFSGQIERLLGWKIAATRVAVQAPVFHDVVLSAMVTSGDALGAEQAIKAFLTERGGVALLMEDDWSPSTQEMADKEPLLGMRALSERKLWLWMIYDNVRNGKGALALRCLEALLG